MKETADRMSKHGQIGQALKAVERELEGLRELENELSDVNWAVEPSLEGVKAASPRPIALGEFLDTTAERVLVIAKRVGDITANMRQMLL